MSTLGETVKELRMLSGSAVGAWTVRLPPDELLALRTSARMRLLASTLSAMVLFSLQKSVHIL